MTADRTPSRAMVHRLWPILAVTAIFGIGAVLANRTPAHAPESSMVTTAGQDQARGTETLRDDVVEVTASNGQTGFIVLAEVNEASGLGVLNGTTSMQTWLSEREGLGTDIVVPVYDADLQTEIGEYVIADAVANGPTAMLFAQ